MVKNMPKIVRKDENMHQEIDIVANYFLSTGFFTLTDTQKSDIVLLLEFMGGYYSQ